MGNEAIEKKIRAAFAKAASLREEARNGRQGSGLSAEDAEREADTALAMAQRLAARHSIDLETLRQADEARGKKVSEPVKTRFYLEEGPYLKHRAGLASQIAIYMGMRTRIATDGSFVLYVGFPEDADMAWQIFQLIEPQMLNGADRQIQLGKHKDEIDWGTRSGHMSAKTYKANYFEAFTNRVTARISESRQQASEEIVFADGIRQEDGTVTGRVTGALVLRTREEKVELFYKEAFPAVSVNPATGRKVKDKTWKAPRTRATSYAARRAGARDGNAARIQPGGEIRNPRKALH